MLYVQFNGINRYLQRNSVRDKMKFGFTLIEINELKAYASS